MCPSTTTELLLAWAMNRRPHGRCVWSILLDPQPSGDWSSQPDAHTMGVFGYWARPSLARNLSLGSPNLSLAMQSGHIWLLGWSKRGYSNETCSTCLHGLFLVYTTTLQIKIRSKKRATRKASGLRTTSEQSTHNKRTDYTQQVKNTWTASAQRRAARSNTKKWSEQLDIILLASTAN